MANKTVYPFGTGGQLPSSIGIINDLTTGGADKALSAEMGKELNKKNFVTRSKEPIFISGIALRTGGIIASDANYEVTEYIDITGYDEIIISSNLWHSNYSPEYDVVPCVFDENKNYIRDVVNIRDMASGSSVVELNNYLYSVQQGDAYIRIPNKKSGGSVNPSLKIAIPIQVEDNSTAIDARNIRGIIDDFNKLTWRTEDTKIYANIRGIIGECTITIKLVDPTVYQVAIYESITDDDGYYGTKNYDTGWQTQFNAYKTRINTKTIHIRLKRQTGSFSSEFVISDIIQELNIVGAPISLREAKQEDPICCLSAVQQLIAKSADPAANSIIKSINHRGYNTIAPENTMPAYILSYQKGFKYVETDVEFTSDGVAVLLHDATINRTARNVDGTSLSSTIYITNITYAEALEYDFGIYKNSAYAGTKIPTLEEFCKFCRATGIHPYVELKSTMTTAQAEEVVSIVNGCGLRGNATFISFSAPLLAAVKNVDSNARLGFLADGAATANTISTIQSLQSGSNEVFFDSSNYNSASIGLCKTANIPYEVWTIDNADTILSFDPYITGVTSNSLKASDIIFNNLGL